MKTLPMLFFHNNFCEVSSGDPINDIILVHLFLSPIVLCSQLLVKLDVFIDT